MRLGLTKGVPAISPARLSQLAGIVKISSASACLVSELSVDASGFNTRDASYRNLRYIAVDWEINPGVGVNARLYVYCKATTGNTYN